MTFLSKYERKNDFWLQIIASLVIIKTSQSDALLHDSLGY
jgi:hypothetical protein